MLEDKLKTKWLLVLIFPSEAMLWIKVVEIVDSLDEWKSSRSINCLKESSKFWDADAKVASQDHPLLIPYWITLIYFLSLFAMIMFRNSIQDGTKSFYICQRFFPMMSWKRIGESDQLIKNWRRWWKESIDQKLRLRNFDARHGRIETGAVVKSRKCSSGVEKRKGVCCRGKKKGQCSKGDQWVSGMEHRKPLHPLSHQWHEVEARREKEASEAEVRLADFFDTRADTMWKVLVPRSPCECWHPPDCPFYKTAECKVGDKCLFPHYKVEEQPS